MNHLPDPITIQQLPDVSDNETIDDSEPDAEEEIDQLDSDSETPPDQQPDAPIPKKPSHTKANERRPGQTLLPAVRIENILQADGVLGSLNLSKEGIFLLSIATEEFIKRLVRAGYQRASEQNRTMVRYNDMAAATQHHYELKFLQDTIPTPRTLVSALALRARREQELVEDDPAMQFQNGRARPQRQPEPPQAMSTPTTSGDSSVVIHEPSEDGPQCPKSEPGLPLLTGHAPGWRPPLPNAPNADAEPLPRERSHCARRSYTPGLSRSQQRKNGTLAPQNPYPNPNTSTNAITEPAQTWEEWKEKSRRLYRTGDDSRRRNSPLNGTSSSQQPPAPPEAFSSEDALRPLLSVSQWDRSEALVNRGDHAEDHHSPVYEHQKTHPSGSLANGNPKDSPPSQFDHSHEKPMVYVQTTQEPWTGPLTGPGSAFLQGPGGPFPRPPPSTPSIPPLIVGPASPAASTPGRTIHSLDNPTD